MRCLSATARGGFQHCPGAGRGRRPARLSRPPAPRGSNLPSPGQRPLVDPTDRPARQDTRQPQPAPDTDNDTAARRHSRPGSQANAPRRVRCQVVRGVPGAQETRLVPRRRGSRIDHPGPTGRRRSSAAHRPRARLGRRVTPGPTTASYVVGCSIGGRSLAGLIPPPRLPSGSRSHPKVTHDSRSAVCLMTARSVWRSSSPDHVSLITAQIPGSFAALFVHEIPPQPRSF